MLTTIRLKFQRGEEVKYISHLDMMKAFDRAVRRSGVPIAFSQGFNPHPQIIFGLPLSVGITSQAEYADFELAEPMKPEELMRRLNGQLPQGLKVLEAREKTAKGNIMASIAAASYLIAAAGQDRPEEAELRRSLESLLSGNEIKTVKEGKSGPKEIDIKPMIREVKLAYPSVDALRSADSTDAAAMFIYKYVDRLQSPDVIPTSYNPQNIFVLSCVVNAGSESNLRPELLFNGFNESRGKDLKLVKIHRTGLFVKAGEKLADPMDKVVLQGV